MKRNPTQGALRDWSARRGMFLSVPVYLEGLDLLRQSLTIPEATAFVETVVEAMPYIPKETFWIARWLEHGGHPLNPQIQARLSADLDARFRPLH